MHNGFADGEARDNVLLKRALLARRFLTSQTCRRKLRASKRKDGETLVQFVARSETYPFPCLELSGKLNWRVFIKGRPFATKLGLVGQHHKPECPEEKKKKRIKVKVAAKVKNVRIFVRMISSELQHSLLPNLVR